MVTDLMKRLKDKEGYNSYLLKEGVLLGNIVYVHPMTIKAYLNNEPNLKYIFIFKEYAINGRSSGYNVIRHRKLTKEILKLLNKYGVLDKI